MKYTKETYEKATDMLNARRESAENLADKHRESFAKIHPELLPLEKELANTGMTVIKAVASGKDASEMIENLSKYNLELQAERARLLAKEGLEINYLRPQYYCQICNDTGRVNGKICNCYDDILKSIAYSSLCATAPLKISTFDEFDVSLYPVSPLVDGVSPQKRMSEILQFCKDYSDDFDLTSGNIFMLGETGLGKTHLSLAIAREAIKKGFGVIYGSAQNLLSKIEAEHFRRNYDDDTDTESLLLNCDLLILDDLGAEFSNSFTVAEIYNIINSRMSAELPTIINSNAELSELEKRYSARVVSRIIGTYHILRFFGNDIRQIKNK
ncbi:MAG: ATP-binding protein [Oscillospiraceae bacterium]